MLLKHIHARVKHKKDSFRRKSEAYSSPVLPSPLPQGATTHRTFVNAEKPLLRLVMFHPELHDMLYQFACKELSSENVHLYDAIREYKECEDFEMKKEMAYKIYDTCVATGCPVQINMPETTKVRVLDQFEMCLFDNYLFTDIEGEVALLLNDTLHRFVSTPHFQDLADELKDMCINEDRSPTDALLLITTEEELKNMFLVFSNVSSSLIDLWESIQRYKMEPIEIKQELANQIAESCASNFEISHDHEIELYINMGLFDNLLFAKVEKEIEDRIFNYVIRFKSTAEYLGFLRKKNRESKRMSARISGCHRSASLYGINL
jgi:hypothetical protein